MGRPACLLKSDTQVHPDRDTNMHVGPSGTPYRGSTNKNHRGLRKLSAGNHLATKNLYPDTIVGAMERILLLARSNIISGG